MKEERGEGTKGNPLRVTIRVPLGGCLVGGGCKGERGGERYPSSPLEGRA